MRRFILVGLTLGFFVACGGGDERTFVADDAGAGATGATAGSSGTSGTAGSVTTGGTGGTAGATGGTAGATGGTAGATGGTAGATGGSAGATGGSAGATGGSAGATGGSAGATGGSAGASGSGGALGCDTKINVCAPDPKAPWVGPIAFQKTKVALAICPKSYPTKLADGGDALLPGAPACQCSCDPAIKIECKNGATVFDIPGTGFKCALNPTQYPKVWSGNAASCTAPDVATTGQVQVIAAPPSDPGGCVSKTNHSIPTPKWSIQTRVCKDGVKAPGVCSAGATCMPQPASPYGLCVYQPGDVACPAAGYTVKSVFYEKFVDTRQCSACSCGKAVSSCRGSVQFKKSCGGTLLTTAQVCEVPKPADIITHSIGNYVPAPTGACPPSKPTVTGSATPTGTVTVCCLP